MLGQKRQRVGTEPAFADASGAGAAVAGTSAGGGAQQPASGEFPAVKLRGLPFDVSEYDIRVFLEDEPVDMLMLKRDGRFSGEAVVVLGSAAQVELAVAKNRSYLGRRYVEVFKAKKLDYYRAVVSEMTDMPGVRGGGGMGGRGGMGGMGAGGMTMDPSMFGGGQGMMGDPSMFGGGQGMMDPSMFGGGGNMFDQSAMGYMGQQIGPQLGGGGMGPMGGGGGLGSGGMMGGGGMMGQGRMGGGTTILKLRGLPFACAEADLIQWFDDPMLGITPLTEANVHMIQDNGRATGMAYVEFPTPQEASAAMMKNKQNLGNRYIEMFPASRFDLDGKAAVQRGNVGF